MDEEVDFLFQYQDVYEHISLEDCEKIYEKDGTSVYSKYLNGISYSDHEDFPVFQYVLYIRTPFSKIQLFPVKDFKVCEEIDTIYMVREEEKFETLQRLTLGKADGSLNVEDLEDDVSMEQAFLEAYGIRENEESVPISDVYFEFAGNEGVIKEYTGRKEDHRANGLKGYASGIEKSTGKRVYIDYEWDEEREKGIVSPCISKSYDLKKDVEDYEQCKEAYERIMSGDWSEVVLVGCMPEGKAIGETSGESIPGLGTPATGMEYMWGMAGEEWTQADINGDGIPELISQNGNGDRTEHKKPIDLIFSWSGGKVELVYVDLIDAMEFLFLSEDGQPIYEWSTSGGPKRSEYTEYHFDEKWKLAFEESLRIFYFLDEDDYTEEEREYYKDQYYRTFGTYGGGLYFQHSRLKTETEIRENDSSYQVKAWISPNQFETEYHRITGRDFLEDNAFYWDAEFEESLTEEKFFDYELRTGNQGERYAVIKGIREAYRTDFVNDLERLINGSWKITFPEQLEGVMVRGFDDYCISGYPFGGLPGIN